MPAVVFFPWVRLKEPLEVGSLRLLHWERCESSGATTLAQQADLDAILRAYTHGAGEPCLSAILLQVA